MSCVIKTNTMETNYKNLFSTTPIMSVAPLNLRGKVLDSYGDSVLGATINEVGNNSNGAVTDFDGNFELPNVSPTSMVSVRYMGQKTRTFKAYETPDVITLEDGIESLDAVHIVATRKKDYTKYYIYGGIALAIIFVFYQISSSNSNGMGAPIKAVV